jgi:ribosome-associated protein
MRSVSRPPSVTNVPPESWGRLISATLPQMPERREIPIRGDMIRLGQLLKLADIVDSGGEARDLLEYEEVLVNGERETRRGRQVHPGDVVAVTDTLLEVVPIDTQ